MLVEKFDLTGNHAGLCSNGGPAALVAAKGGLANGWNCMLQGLKVLDLAEGAGAPAN